jgi:hypothetical protein
MGTLAQSQSKGLVAPRRKWWLRALLLAAAFMLKCTGSQRPCDNCAMACDINQVAPNIAGTGADRLRPLHHQVRGGSRSRWTAPGWRRLWAVSTRRRTQFFHERQVRGSLQRSQSVFPADTVWRVAATNAGLRTASAEFHRRTVRRFDEQNAYPVLE